jgi:hypothetical protein
LQGKARNLDNEENRANFEGADMAPVEIGSFLNLVALTG